MAMQPNIADFLSANQQAAQRYANLAMQSAQRMLRVQMDVTRDLMSRNSTVLREAWPQMDPSRPEVNWSALVGSQVRAATEIARNSMEGAARVYSEYARIVQEQGPQLADAVTQASQQTAQAAQQGMEQFGQQMRDITQGVGQRGLEVARQTADDTQRFSEEVGRKAAETVSATAGHAENTAQAAERRTPGGTTRRAS